METREDKFEGMLQAVLARYRDTVLKMDALKAAGKTKTVTFRQLMGDKLTYQNMLIMYQLHGLIDGSWRTDGES